MKHDAKRGLRQPSLIFVFVAVVWLWATIAPASPTAIQEAPPLLQTHPLPPTLAQWQPDNQEDYFAAIQPSPAGYLVWSRFPVRVYVEPVEAEAAGLSSDRSQAWAAAVRQALQEWSVYLPLAEVDTVDAANIQIWRRTPPLQPADVEGDRPIQLSRVQTAETRYQLFVDRTTPAATLAHQFTIYLSPNQTSAYTLATARHELGHALGIWGHSPLSSDALYFSQVRNSPRISQRDVNTLRRIYEQPTQIGWKIVLQPTPSLR